MHRMEISRLKLIAATAHNTMSRIADGVDCGANLLSHISPEYRMAEAQFNVAIKRLMEIDPSFPKERSKRNAT